MTGAIKGASLLHQARLDPQKNNNQGRDGFLSFYTQHPESDRTSGFNKQGFLTCSAKKTLTRLAEAHQPIKYYDRNGKRRNVLEIPNCIRYLFLKTLYPKLIRSSINVYSTTWNVLTNRVRRYQSGDAPTPARSSRRGPHFGCTLIRLKWISLSVYVNQLECMPFILVAIVNSIEKPRGRSRKSSDSTERYQPIAKNSRQLIQRDSSQVQCQKKSESSNG